MKDLQTIRNKRLIVDKKKNNGITLIALVVTIIVLLILAGITISLVVGQNGIITRANQAKIEQRGASVEEQANLWRADNEIAKIQGKQYYESDTQIIDRLHGIGLLTDDDVKDIANSPNKEVTIGSRTINFKLEEEDKTALKIRVNTGTDGIVGLPVTQYYRNFTIDWGDGTIQDTSSMGKIVTERKKVASITIEKELLIASQRSSAISHTYTEKNKEYIVTITGECTLISTDFTDVTEEKIIEIVQWGETGLEQVQLSYCSNLVRIAEPSEKSFEKIEDFSYAFIACKALETIPQNLFANCPNATDFQATFSTCESLKQIPENLFTKCPNVTRLMGTFYNCTNLTGKAPELWTRGTNSAENNYQGNPDGEACFANCSKLDNYTQIPDYWKQEPLPT